MISTIIDDLALVFGASFSMAIHEFKWFCWRDRLLMVQFSGLRYCGGEGIEIPPPEKTGLLLHFFILEL